ncbi:hypothetical protein C9374_005111 [Naegleria lovaniensis]|uniref:Golgi SNAP receptor complex member 1 n=1 Tax=Naegleria lovaniensis TaxID=51637 RepID=A0AA88GKA4_NAELO|nr:uncharacterized protein C9374_005111 [Naegleria lovaniensis]KAG2382531.1 hypothetical protein C9374_005111 [Naegleria lovaniensis]
MNQYLKQSSQLENKIEQKLITFSNLASKIEEELFQNPTPSLNNISSSEELFKKVSEEIDHLLKELREVNDKMKEFINDENNHSLITSSTVYQYDQHLTIYNNCKKEYRTIKQRVSNKKNRNDLLYLSDEDVENNENDSLLGLNNRFGSDIQRMRDANTRMQNLITQGQYSKATLEEQMEMFKSFDHVLNGMKARFPAIDGLLTRIQQKNRRDMIILAFVIAACIITLLLLTIAP